MTACAHGVWAWAALLVACYAAEEKEAIRVPGWPDLSAKVPLSPGIVSRGLVLASGMAGIDMTTFKRVEGGVRAETAQALKLVGQVLAAGGTDFAHVAGCAVYLQDLKDFADMNEVYKSFFPKPRPSRVAMQVSKLAGNASVEIQCHAAVPSVYRKEVVVPDWPDMTERFPFSTGIVAGDYVFASGMQGIDFQSGRLAPGGVAEETAQTLSNIRRVVEQAGSSMADVVDCAVCLKDMRDFAAMNQAYTRFFAKPQPSRVAMQVVGLAGNASVEIQCVAAMPSIGRRPVAVPGWPDLGLPFSNGIVAGGLVFASGLAGFDLPASTKLVPGGIAAETEQALKLVRQVVEAGGTSMGDVVSCAVYLKDMADFAAMNEVYTRFFPKPPPARVATQIAGLVEGAAVEIQCLAALPAAPPPALVV